tara:strand:+ start:6057 stop:6332 length:276 start_codon:yes stop_codon:yes gene_type:complete
MKEVRAMLAAGKYRYVGHANERLQERSVSRLEVKQVLKNGHHEKRKDEFKEEHTCWNYSIRGKTVDKKNLRIAVSFDKSNMLIITVIDLDK